MAKSTSSRKANTGKLGSTAQARIIREGALNQARRSLILDAARAAFSELGLDGASLREIAKRAGYTPGAIYSYFANLEEIYGALLGESLQRLNQVVHDAKASTRAKTRTAETTELLRAKVEAFYTFYRDNPKELDLGFYLFNGAKPRGLTPELNRALNEQLLASLQPVRDLLVTAGLNTDEATVETSAVFAHIVGTLVLTHTGRIRLFQQSPDALFEKYMNSLIQRLPVSHEQDFT